MVHYELKPRGDFARPGTRGLLNSSGRDGTERETPCTLGQAIGRTANVFPNQPAIISATYAPLTYRDLQRQLDDIRRQLRLARFDCR
jgi:hypothetical protein